MPISRGTCRIKSSFSTALICTTRRQIPARARKNQVPRQRRFDPTGVPRLQESSPPHRGPPQGPRHRPAVGAHAHLARHLTPYNSHQIAFFCRLDLHNKSLDSGDYTRGIRALGSYGAQVIGVWDAGDKSREGIARAPLQNHVYNKYHRRHTRNPATGASSPTHPPASVRRFMLLLHG